MKKQKSRTYLLISGKCLNSALVPIRQFHVHEHEDKRSQTMFSIDNYQVNEVKYLPVGPKLLNNKESQDHCNKLKVRPNRLT